MVIAAASQLLGALRRISVSQAPVIFISTDGVCQWLASLYAGINKSWEKIVLSRASQAEIMALEFFLCTHEVTAFVVFSIYFMFMRHSQSLALKYPRFSSMGLILFSIKSFLGLRAHCLQPPIQHVKPGLQAISGLQRSHTSFSILLFWGSPIMLEKPSCIFKAGITTCVFCLCHGCKEGVIPRFRSSANFRRCRFTPVSCLCLCK